MKTKYNWKLIQQEYDTSERGYTHLKQKFGVSSGTISNAIKRGEFIPRSKKESAKLARKHNPNIGKMTQEIKNKISKSMKNFMKNNPEKCPYLQNHYSKGDSYPEKYFKKCFNRKFQEKFRILNYQLDFADIENKIDIEIDGEQHFVDTRIRKSDARRNQRLSELGWTIIRIRWSLFKKLEYLDKKQLIQCILNYQDCTFDCYLKLVSDPNEEKIKKYTEIYQTKKIKIKTETTKKIIFKTIKKKPCPQCQNLIHLKSKLCKKCSEKHSRKIKWPPKEELSRLVWEKPTSHLAKQFKVSDIAISKWCKKYKIEKPPRGYWAKIHSKKIIN